MRGIPQRPFGSDSMEVDMPTRPSDPAATQVFDRVNEALDDYWGSDRSPHEWDVLRQKLLAIERVSKAELDLTVQVNVRDLPRMLLLIGEWESLIHDMRIGASPFAERVEHMLDRFQADIASDEVAS